MATTAQAITPHALDPVLPHENRAEFNALIERYQAEHKPKTAHQEFLVSLMAAAQWKLQRAGRIETAMFSALDNSGDPAAAEAAMAQAFLNHEKSGAFARLERYRASLERTWQRCAHELRESGKIQHEADSRENIEKQLEEAVKNRMAAPLPPSFMAILADMRKKSLARQAANDDTRSSYPRPSAKTQ